MSEKQIISDSNRVTQGLNCEAPKTNHSDPEPNLHQASALRGVWPRIASFSHLFLHLIQSVRFILSAYPISQIFYAFLFFCWISHRHSWLCHQFPMAAIFSCHRHFSLFTSPFKPPIINDKREFQFTRPRGNASVRLTRPLCCSRTPPPFQSSNTQASSLFFLFWFLLTGNFIKNRLTL